jgi:hypothetical protein
MGGKYITKHQVKLYMKYRESDNLNQHACAAKAGMSTRSARTIDHGQHHTQKPQKPRNYKTRESPIDDIWGKELVSMLEKNPDLQPKTLLIYIQRTYTDDLGMPLYDGSVLRTLQRRVATWQALNGKPKDVMFPQVHIPGQQGLSDFTHMNRSEITINGVAFKHMLYHFRLVYSKWSYVKVIQGGESFQALSEGLQEALLNLGGSPKEHRTDSLSAAYKNRVEDTKEDLTIRYNELCEHYQMEPTRNNKGVSHENGSVESAHGHLKNRINQELLLRDSNDFESLLAYETWLQNIVLHSNKRNSKNFSIEKEALQTLPGFKAMDYDLILTKVSSLSVIVVRNMTYSAPSRLAGHILTLHLYQHTIEGYLGGSLVLDLKRKYRHEQATRYVINYRHIIHALIKKPRAFRNCKYQNEILPSTTYQQIWKHLDLTESKDVSPKIMLRILKLAADYDCEYNLGEHVLNLVENESPIDIQIIERDFNGSNPPLPTVNCEQHELISYDNCIPNINNKQPGDNNYATI